MLSGKLGFHVCTGHKAKPERHQKRHQGIGKVHVADNSQISAVVVGIALKDRAHQIDDGCGNEDEADPLQQRQKLLLCPPSSTAGTGKKRGDSHTDKLQKGLGPMGGDPKKQQGCQKGPSKKQQDESQKNQLPPCKLPAPQAV